MRSVAHKALRDTEALWDHPTGLLALALYPVMVGAFLLCLMALGAMEAIRLLQGLTPPQRGPSPR